MSTSRTPASRCDGRVDVPRHGEVEQGEHGRGPCGSATGSGLRRSAIRPTAAPAAASAAISSASAPGQRGGSPARRRPRRVGPGGVLLQRGRVHRRPRGLADAETAAARRPVQRPPSSRRGGGPPGCRPARAGRPGRGGGRTGAARERRRDRLGGQDQTGRAGAGHDDIGTCQLVGTVVHRHRAGRHPARLGQDLRRAARRAPASGWRRRSRRHPARASVAAASEDIEPGADDQGPLARAPSSATSAPSASCSRPKVTSDCPARSIPVSLCARLPTRSACWNRSLSSRPGGVQLLRRARARP